MQLQHALAMKEMPMALSAYKRGSVTAVESIYKYVYICVCVMCVIVYVTFLIIVKSLFIDKRLT